MALAGVNGTVAIAIQAVVTRATPNIRLFFSLFIMLLDQSAKKRKTQMPHADGSKPSAQDLLLCAKHLFVAAMVAWVHPGPAAKRELIDLRP